MTQENNKYRVEENKLIIGNREIVFDYFIKEFIEIGNMLIVHLDLFDKVIPIEENVFGINLIEKKENGRLKKEITLGAFTLKCDALLLE